MVGLIWATRGRSWGFRFLLDGGFAEPLLTYERFFVGTEGEMTVCQHRGGRLALRFPDPLNRKDAAGRPIPHDFVVPAPTADSTGSADVGLREIWPLVADTYARVWDADKAPSVAEIQSAINRSNRG